MKIEREATDDKLTEMAKSEFNGHVSAQVRIEIESSFLIDH